MPILRIRKSIDYQFVYIIVSGGVSNFFAEGQGEHNKILMNKKMTKKFLIQINFNFKKLCPMPFFWH